MDIPHTARLKFPLPSPHAVPGAAPACSRRARRHSPPPGPNLPLQLKVGWLQPVQWVLDTDRGCPILSTPPARCGTAPSACTRVHCDSLYSRRDYLKTITKERVDTLSHVLVRSLCTSVCPIRWAIHRPSSESGHRDLPRLSRNSVLTGSSGNRCMAVVSLQHRGKPGFFLAS